VWPRPDNPRVCETEFSYLLGPTNPCPTTVDREPFSSSVFKVPIWIFATTTKICTGVCSSLPRGRPSTQTPRPPTRKDLFGEKSAGGVWPRARLSSFHPFGRVWVARLAPSIFRASSFGRWVVTHSLADSDFHGHRPAVCMNQHLLNVWNERAVGHLNPTFGWSHIASSAYQKWPTGNSSHSKWRHRGETQVQSRGGSPPVGRGSRKDLLEAPTAPSRRQAAWASGPFKVWE